MADFVTLVGDLHGSSNLWDAQCYEKRIEQPLLTARQIPLVQQHVNPYLIAIRDSVKPLSMQLRLMVAFVLLSMRNSWYVTGLGDYLFEQLAHPIPYGERYALTLSTAAFVVGLVALCVAYQRTNATLIKATSALIAGAALLAFVCTVSVYVRLAAHYEKATQWVYTDATGREHAYSDLQDYQAQYIYTQLQTLRPYVKFFAAWFLVTGGSVLHFTVKNCETLALVPVRLALAEQFFQRGPDFARVNDSGSSNQLEMHVLGGGGGGGGGGSAAVEQRANQDEEAGQVVPPN